MIRLLPQSESVRLSLRVRVEVPHISGSHVFFRLITIALLGVEVFTEGV